ncbi:MAG: serine hydrolase domain-containing protein [Candidatus Spyradocola sp.]|jgi:CubicO group peptidase (beta-lactamase class C family)
MDPMRKARLDSVLKEAVDSGEIAGAVAMLNLHGQEIYYGESGLADREAGRPMRRDTIFRLFSMSKPVTACAAMILLERGQIDLLDPVSKYLPGFRNQVYWDGAALRPVDVPATIKDLLGMTSGLVYGGEIGFAETRMQSLWSEVQAGQARGEETGTVDFANRMGQMPLAFAPGSRWQYGVSADVMGAVVEVASGKRFGDFLREEIFAPLHMTDTGFWIPEEKRERFAAVYRQQGPELVRWTGAHLCILPLYDREPAFQSGGAGLVSTLDDYARFAQMLARGGELDGARILSPRTVRFMRQNQLTHAQRATCTWDSLRGHGYGNFMRVLLDEGQAPSLGSKGEFGWDGWLGTYFCVSPEDDLVLLLMLQKTDTGTIDVTRKFRSAAFAALD